MAQSGLSEADADTILDQVVAFPDGSHYERLESMTNFRKDNGVARILYRCRRRASDGSLPEEETNKIYVMKVKFQVPSAEMKEPVEEPNPETVAELHALRTFAMRKQTSVPHLVTWKKTAQETGSLFPGGYLVIMVMTLVPGRTLLDLGFWGLTTDEQDTVRNAFLKTLKDIWRVGFVPYDRGLRNIMWCKETGQCSIVDFEHYYTESDLASFNDRQEMEQWGIVQRPALNWYQEWALSAPKRPK